MDELKRVFKKLRVSEVGIMFCKCKSECNFVDEGM